MQRQAYLTGQELIYRFPVQQERKPWSEHFLPGGAWNSLSLSCCRGSNTDWEVRWRENWRQTQNEQNGKQTRVSNVQPVWNRMFSKNMCLTSMENEEHISDAFGKLYNDQSEKNRQHLVRKHTVQCRPAPREAFLWLTGYGFNPIIAIMSINQHVSWQKASEDAECGSAQKQSCKCLKQRSHWPRH